MYILGREYSVYSFRREKKLQTDVIIISSSIPPLG